jgi:hypothetical protein
VRHDSSSNGIPIGIGSTASLRLGAWHGDPPHCSMISGTSKSVSGANYSVAREPGEDRHAHGFLRCALRIDPLPGGVVADFSK